MDTTEDYIFFRDREHCNDYVVENAKVTLGESDYFNNIHHYELHYGCHVGFYNKAGPNTGILDCLHLSNGQIRVLGRKPICVLDVESIGVGIGVAATLLTIITILSCLYLKQRKLNKTLQRNNSERRRNSSQRKRIYSIASSADENISIPDEPAPLPRSGSASLPRNLPSAAKDKLVYLQSGGQWERSRRMSMHKPSMLGHINPLQHMVNSREKEFSFYSSNTYERPTSKSNASVITSGCEYPRMQGRVAHARTSSRKGSRTNEMKLRSLIRSRDSTCTQTSHLYDDPDKIMPGRAGKDGDEMPSPATYYSAPPNEQELCLNQRAGTDYSNLSLESIQDGPFSHASRQLSTGSIPRTLGQGPRSLLRDYERSSSHPKDIRPASRASVVNPTTYYSQPPQEQPNVSTILDQQEVYV